MGDRQKKLEENVRNAGFGELMKAAKGERDQLREGVMSNFMETVFEKMKIKRTFEARDFEDGVLKIGHVNQLKDAILEQLEEVEWTSVFQILNLNNSPDTEGVKALKEWIALKAVEALEKKVNETVKGYKSFERVEVEAENFFNYSVNVKEGVKEAGAEGGDAEVADELAAVPAAVPVAVPAVVAEGADQEFEMLQNQLNKDSENQLLGMVKKVKFPLGLLLANILSSKDENGETMISRLLKNPEENPILAAGLGALGVDKFAGRWKKAVDDLKDSPQGMEMAGKVGGALARLGEKVPAHLKVARVFNFDTLTLALEKNYFSQLNKESFLVKGRDGKAVEVSGKQFKISWPKDKKVIFAEEGEQFKVEMVDDKQVATVGNISDGTIFPPYTMIELVDEN